MSSRPNPAVITGNDALVKWNGTTAGFLKNIELNVNNHVERIQALGQRKPKGLKSLDWQGSLSGEFHILSTPQDGVVSINTHDDDHADDLYDILIIEKKTSKRVGLAIGMVNTDGFSLSNNEFSGRRIELELLDWEPMEGFN
ncbi:hypothetical protein EHO57_13925 [Leptospira langatensis]|uniref:Uncharacterized protein n=1 Tax=Leptospira langatensis TaxID=2484983 RepID=A0A5R2AT56_9LEPT|nr:hypothetical protein [Leptospira langatensis]TGJ99854.1 hypothetical protein EHO57_13925 [Leptospira langatensis]